MTVQDWCRQLEAEPDDWGCWQAFSDWLKENDFPLEGHAAWWVWKTRIRPNNLYLWTWDFQTGWLRRRGGYYKTLWEAVQFMAKRLEECRRAYEGENVK